jgi:hypothetical protein
VERLGHFEFLAGFRMWAVEDRRQLLEVVGRPAVEVQVLTAFDVRRGGDLMNTAADQQIPRQSPRRRMLTTRS